jgi:uncharacterized protein YjbI with pentapeptide repeats
MPQLNKHIRQLRDTAQSREQTLKSIWENPPKLNQTQLDQFMLAHQFYVERRPKGRRMIMRFLQLHTLSLKGRNMTEAELTGSCLYACDLSGANFERANLYCADMRLADATGANFYRADLRGVTLRGAILTRAMLDGADLRSAVVAVADEVKGLAILRHKRDAATNRGPALGDDGETAEFAVDFTDASLAGAKLQGANLKHANFKGANLAGANLDGARLEGVNLQGAILTGIDVARLGLYPSQLVGCVVDPTPQAREQAAFLDVRLEEAERWWTTGGKEGHPAMMDGEDLRVIVNIFAGRSLTAMSAQDAMGVGVNFSGTMLQSARFDGADLRTANFEGADLRGASFRNANLTRARFAGAQIGPLLINNRIVRATDFEGARNADLSGSEAIHPETANRAG